MKIYSASRAFTLIEILVVIGIIAVLAAIVVIAINPARQFAQARNTQRTSNVNTLLNAIGQRLADNKGVWLVSSDCGALVAGTSTIAFSTVSSSTPLAPATDVVNMSCLTPTYIPSQLPVDPSTGVWHGTEDYNTQYNVTTTTLGRWTICAPNGNESALANPGPICATR